MVILGVGLEVFGQVVDALAEDGHLDFRGAGVSIMGLVTANELGLAVLGQRHLRSSTNAPEPSADPDAPYDENQLVEQYQHVRSEQQRDAKPRTCPPRGRCPGARLACRLTGSPSWR